jgi:hypothetical protein
MELLVAGMNSLKQHHTLYPRIYDTLKEHHEFGIYAPCLVGLRQHGPCLQSAGLEISNMQMANADEQYFHTNAVWSKHVGYAFHR